jgi:3'-phosphoadenosine 5'-phosphosulfate sulfotransferase (PAPS reductase)/FAD synthetase
LLKLAARPLDTPPVTPSASQLGLKALQAQQLAALNREFAQRSPLDILLWLQSSNLGNVVQFTSFGLSGMVITDLMAKLNYDVPIAFVDTLHHFEEVRGRREKKKKGMKRKKKHMSRHFPPLFGIPPFFLCVTRPCDVLCPCLF